MREEREGGGSTRVVSWVTRKFPDIKYNTFGFVQVIELSHSSSYGGERVGLSSLSLYFY